MRSSDSQYAAAGTAPPWPWAVEKRAVFATFEFEGSAFSVARRFCDGGRRDARPTDGGRREEEDEYEYEHEHDSEWRGRSSLHRRPTECFPFSNGETWPTFAAGNLCSVVCKFSTGHPGPGLLKSGPYSRLSSSKVRRFLLRDGFVTAVAGMPGLRTAEGGKKKTSTSTSTIRRGAVDRVYIDGRLNASPSPMGKPSATFAAGNLRSVICKFSTGPPGPRRNEGRRRRVRVRVRARFGVARSIEST